jgi:hypothetical protein
MRRGLEPLFHHLRKLEELPHWAFTCQAKIQAKHTSSLSKCITLLNSFLNKEVSYTTEHIFNTSSHFYPKSKSSSPPNKVSIMTLEKQMMMMMMIEHIHISYLNSIYDELYYLWSKPVLF